MTNITSKIFNNAKKKILVRELKAHSEFALLYLDKNIEITRTDLALNNILTLETLNYLSLYDFEKTSFYMFLFGSIKNYKRTLIIVLTLSLICLLLPTYEPIGYYFLIHLIFFLCCYNPIKARILIQEGVNEYNNKNFSKALNLFQQAQNLVPNDSYELNHFILASLIQTSTKKNEVLNYIDTHFATTKRSITFFYLLKIKNFEEAINYFNKSFTQNEIEQSPSILIYPVIAYKSLKIEPQQILDYIDSKYNLNIQQIRKSSVPTFNQLIDEYNFIFLQILEDLYITTKNKKRLKTLYIKMHELKPEDIIVSERLRKLIQEESF